MPAHILQLPMHDMENTYSYKNQILETNRQPSFTSVVIAHVLPLCACGFWMNGTWLLVASVWLCFLHWFGVELLWSRYILYTVKFGMLNLLCSSLKDWEYPKFLCSDIFDISSILNLRNMSTSHYSIFADGLTTYFKSTKKFHEFAASTTMFFVSTYSFFGDPGRQHFIHFCWCEIMFFTVLFTSSLWVISLVWYVQLFCMPIVLVN